MTSDLSFENFAEKLKRITSIGEPALKGTPLFFVTLFDSNEKPFFGQLQNGKFRLTNNSVVFATPYIIEGKYESGQDSGTRVQYKIKRIWFGYLWSRIIPIIGIIFVNILLTNIEDNLPYQLFIFMNIFVLILFVPLLAQERKKKQMEKIFIKEFHLR